MSVFHAEAPQATASEGLAQGLYVAAKAGFEPTTDIDSTNDIDEKVVKHYTCMYNHSRNIKHYCRSLCGVMQYMIYTASVRVTQALGPNVHKQPPISVHFLNL